MLTFEAPINFSVATPPRTGGGWFLSACKLVGLKDFGDDQILILNPAPRDHEGFVVSIVRHPVEWLVSLYHNRSKIPATHKPIEMLCELANKSEDSNHFLRRVIETYDKKDAGIISQTFDSYQYHSAMRLEDMPWAAIEFFESVGIPREKSLALRNLPAQNVREGLVHPRDKGLSREIIEVEYDWCAKFDYWG